MKRILVTGDRGYIGSTLVPILIKKGYKVTGYDTNYYEYFPQLNYEARIGDIRNITLSDLKKIDAVIHLAALSNDPLGNISDNLTQEINYKSTIKLAKLAKKAGVKRFLFSSSCSIYGISSEDFVSESSKINPMTSYAKSKIKAEKELIKLGDNKFCVGIMRNSTVYGYSPNFRSDLVVNDFMLSALQKGKIEIKSDGTPWRPLIDVRDLSEIFLKFLNIEGKKITGRIINVGFSENNIQVKDLASLVSKVTGKPVRYSNHISKDSRSYKVDFSQFKKIFPTVRQHWRLEKSVLDLFTSLNKEISSGNLSSKKYIRLNALNQLQEVKKIDKNLYWIKKKYLITGATGFVGSNIVRKLVNRNEEVHVIVRSRKLNWRIKDLESKIHVYETDLTSPGLKKITNSIKPDIIFHLAAYGSMPDESDISKMFQVNIAGTSNLINALKNHPFKLFVNTGTSAEYGLKDKPMKENDQPEPINDYGISKLAQTNYATKEAKINSLPIITFRLFSVYGPYENSSRLIPTVVENSIKRKKINLGNPNYVRDFVYVDDVTEAYIQAVNSVVKMGEIYNIGSGKQSKISDVVKYTQKINNYQLKVVWNKVPKQKRQIEPSRWEADVKKASNQLKWVPRTDLEAGIAHTIEWYKNRKEN